MGSGRCEEDEEMKRKKITRQDRFDLDSAPPQAIIEHCAQIAESFKTNEAREVAAAIREWKRKDEES